MHKIFHVKAYEQKHGPHFNEEYARKAVSKMENEDGTRGPHWSVEETTSIANQFGIILTGAFNKYDWFVALNMVYSDFYKVISSITNSVNIKHFVEFAKAWLKDKDIDEGKMWYYYIYIMCDKIRDEESEMYEDQYGEDNEDYFMPRSRMNSRMRRISSMRRSSYDYDPEEYDDEYRSAYSEQPRSRSMRYVRY